jgi:hypothetical protein
MYGNQMAGNEDDFFNGRLDDEENIDYNEPYEPEEREEDNN